MDPLTDLGRWIAGIGLLLILTGGLLWLLGRIPGLDRVPGTWVWEGENVKVVAPIGAMIVVSIVLTILLNVIGRFFR